jgi:hypothetical protein
MKKSSTDPRTIEERAEDNLNAITRTLQNFGLDPKEICTTRAQQTERENVLTRSARTDGQRTPPE